MTPGFQMRHAQACHCAELSTGRDFLGVGATGSGKSLSMFLPAAARALEARREGSLADLKPVDLLLAPFANVAVALEEAGNDFLEGVALGQTPPWKRERYSPRVLYVERSQQVAGGGQGTARQHASTRPSSGRTCPSGHVLLWHGREHQHRAMAREATCDVCHEDIALRTAWELRHL